MNMPSASPQQSRPGGESTDLPGQPDRPRVAEGADRAPTERSTGLKVVVAVLACIVLLGGVFVARNLFNSEVPATVPAANRGSEKSEAGLETAHRLQQQGRFGEAEAILSRAVERNATDQSARVAYAQALIGLKKYKPAYEQYEAAIALTKPVPNASQPARDPGAAQLHFEAGTCASMADLQTRAQEHYWMAQSLDPGEAKYPLYLAMTQIKAGDQSAANASLLRAVKLRPDLAEAWGTMAELALQQNRLGLAEQHVAEARRIQPESVRWRLVEARVCNRKNEPAKAAALLAGLRPEQRSDKSVLAVLGEAYGLLGQPAEAAAIYAEAASAAPHDADLNFDAAVWLQRSGDRARAAVFARTAANMGHTLAGELLEELKAQAGASPE